MAPAVGFQPELQPDNPLKPPDLDLSPQSLWHPDTFPEPQSASRSPHEYSEQLSAVSCGGALFGLLRDEPRLIQKMSQDYAANCASRIANGHPERSRLPRRQQDGGSASHK